MTKHNDTPMMAPVSRGGDWEELIFGLVGLPRVVGGPGKQMRCPTCQEHSPDAWQFAEFPLRIDDRVIRRRPQETLGRYDEQSELESRRGFVSLDWMHCANNDCKELVVRLHVRTVNWAAGVPLSSSETRIVAPLSGNRWSVSQAVPEEYREDFIEAAAILDISPRMSAVLSRRLLADLLKVYAGRHEYGLSDQVRQFTKDKSWPFNLRQNVDILRSMGDFGAHLKRDKSDQSIVVNVSREEAEWTLEVVARLFDEMIVKPIKDAEMRQAFNQKRIDSGSDPLPELLEDEAEG